MYGYKFQANKTDFHSWTRLVNINGFFLKKKNIAVDTASCWVIRATTEGSGAHPSRQSWPEEESSKAVGMLHFMGDKSNSGSQINGTGKQNKSFSFYWAPLSRKCFIDPRDEHCDVKRFAVWEQKKNKSLPHTLESLEWGDGALFFFFTFHI